jgi:integrase
MSVKKDPKTGKFEVRVSARSPHTKKPKNLYRKGFATKAEALRAEKQMWKQLWQSFEVEKSPFWEDVREEHLQKLIEANEVSLGYIKEKGLTLGKYTSAWDHLPVNQITTQMLRDVIVQAQVSESRKKEVLKAIRHALNYAVEAGYLDSSPCPAMKFNINKKMFGVLNEQQMKKLLSEAKKCGTLWYYVWAMAIYTGMRNGELYALHWEDIEAQRALILVRRSYNKAEGVVDKTKGGYDRIVEIAPPLKKILKELRKITGDTPFVLPRIKEWDQGQQAKILREFCNQIKIPSIRFHDLRASYATFLLNQGIAAGKIMASGGWTDMKTFEMYLRKAGINVRGTTSVFKDFEDDEDDE